MASEPSCSACLVKSVREMMMPMSDLDETLKTLPKLPGVYLMKGKRAQVLYVGKAKVLANRVRSYFQSGGEVTPKIRALVSQIVAIETIVTGSELEALLLENNLIKRHRPKYNVILRDDKNYPLLRLSLKDDYPRLETVRRIQKDGALYFGPYVSAAGLREMLKLLRRIFPLPNCSIEIDGQLERPCLEFEIKRCLAPCTGYQSQQDYRRMIDQVVLFLRGKDKRLVKDLKALMAKRAEALDFESAARLRDQVVRVERVLQQQRITSSKMEDLDVVALARKNENIDIQILFIRGGMVIGKKDFFLEDVAETSDDALCTAFLQRFYHKEVIIPKTILLPSVLRDKGLLEAWLSERRGEVVKLRRPMRGEGAALIRLAEENAESALSGHLQILAGGEAQLLKLKALLGLKKLPMRIEGYDISNIGGTNAVGSMVVFEAGKAKKADYRHFRIQTVEGSDDFAMMAEVLGRRLKSEKLRPQKLKEETFPDLILIDGGKGQVSSVLAVLDQMNCPHIDLIGLAKERDERGERVYLPGASEPIELAPASSVTHLLMQVRDEAHRFAVSYHRKLRSKTLFETPLQKVEGIGPLRRRALLKHFGSLNLIRQATLEALQTAPRMNMTVAKRLFEDLQKSEDSR